MLFIGLLSAFYGASQLIGFGDGHVRPEPSARSRRLLAVIPVILPPAPVHFGAGVRWDREADGRAEPRSNRPESQPSASAGVSLGARRRSQKASDYGSDQGMTSARASAPHGGVSRAWIACSPRKWRSGSSARELGKDDVGVRVGGNILGLSVRTARGRDPVGGREVLCWLTIRWRLAAASLVTRILINDFTLQEVAAR